MAKVISSLPGSTGILSRTSQLTNDGESGVSTYVELNDLSTVATTGDYNNLINVPIDFTPKVHTHNISDISGTKSEFNTSLTDGDFLFVGDVSDTPDATTTSKGVIKLAGDLAGTADVPTVPGLANKVDKVAGKSLIADAEITRLATLNNYTHPANHPPSIITQDASNRFVTDVEKTAWNAKQSNLGYTPENVANKATTLTASTTLYPNNDAVIAGLATKEDNANKVTSIGSSANDTNYPSELAVKTYADNLVVGMLNDRGTWDASGNVFPTTGGSGVGGVIRKGDMWYVSVAGTLGTKSVNVGDSFRALVNAPAQVAANWSILEANIGYVPANDLNIVHLTGAETITGQKTFSPTISASGAIARGTYLTPSLTATANNDVLVGLDINTTFTNGAFTGTTSLPVRVTSNQYIGMNVSRNSTGDSAITISNNNGGYNFGVGSINEFFIQRAGGNIVNTIFPTGNSIIQNGGTFTDDGINRLQVTGTVSSGTTTLGNTPPTANNQLTRKDYVDTGLNSKEPSFAKNTAFNKNFGTTAGTVAQGNDSRILNGQTAFGWGSHLGLYYKRNSVTYLVDCNVAEDGIITGFQWTNAPADGIASLKTVIYSRDWIEQKFTLIGAVTDIWTRTRHSGTTWSGWILTWTENNFNPANYLPLSGGTLTGNLNGKNATFTESIRSLAYVYSGRGSLNGGGFVIPSDVDATGSRNWKIRNDVWAYGDFSIQQSTDHTESSYTTRLYIDAAGRTTFSSTVTATAIKLTSLPVYANNSAATSGGLAVGDVYRTSTGVLMVKF